MFSHTVPNSIVTRPLVLRNDRRKPPVGLTLLEVFVIIAILAILVALLIPAVMSAREAARRMTCASHLRMIGSAVHDYAQLYKEFPPGTICALEPIQPSNQYDVWAEAAKTEPGFHGTSFLRRILPWTPYGDPLCQLWDCTHAAGYTKLAQCEIEGFYCPSRRSAFRRGIDEPMMLTSMWTGGGTDYGGCAGRHAAFTNETGYNLCDASMVYTPDFVPTGTDMAGSPKKAGETEATRWGIFGRVNVGTTFTEITDGLSNTIMIGELQRITDITPGSKDGWAIGGPATLFTTGAMMQFDGKACKSVASPDIGAMMNNHFFGSPGSEHSGGANFGMGDGSVRWLLTSIDPNVFALLGGMADGTFMAAHPGIE